MSWLVLTFLLATGPTWHYTFDDGPQHDTDAILDILARHHIKATWYIMGVQLTDPRNWPRLRRIVREGHRLGNHLYSHASPCRDMVRRNGSVVKALGVQGTLWELRKTETLVSRALGQHYRMDTWRPPFGHRCPAVERQVAKAGYSLQLWDLQYLGSGKHLCSKALQKPAAVLLWHYQVGVLDRFIRTCRP